VIGLELKGLAKTAQPTPTHHVNVLILWGRMASAWIVGETIGIGLLQKGGLSG
jgi:hypothetical protein